MSQKANTLYFYFSCMYDNVAIITENVLQSPKSYSLNLILGYLKYLIKGWV